MINFDTWPPNAGTKPYDPYNPEARDIYWDYLNKGVFSFNTDAWWLDSSEPDHINVQEKDFDQPTFLGSLPFGDQCVPFATRQRHLRAPACNDFRQAGSYTYPVGFCRTAALRSQHLVGRYCVQLGNTSETNPCRISFSLSANPYWNADIGGFFLWISIKAIH